MFFHDSKKLFVGVDCTASNGWIKSLLSSLISHLQREREKGVRKEEGKQGERKREGKRREREREITRDY